MDEIIEQEREHLFHRGPHEGRLPHRGEQRQCRLPWPSLLLSLQRQAGCHHIPPEAYQVVVASIERNPGDRREITVCTACGDPLIHHRRFAEASRSLKQSECVEESTIELGQQARTFHQQGRQARGRQLRRQ